MAEPQSLHEVTPLWRSLPISRATGRTVRLKMEALQPTGSFKIRGIGRLCAQAVAHGTRRFVSSSGGNAGVAVAYAGHVLNIPVTVHVFKGVPETARQRMEELGAEVLMAGPTWEQAHQAATEAAMDPSVFYVHPFDHPEIWHGHSTMIDEIVAAGVRPELIVLSVGGGGMLCGVLEGLERNGLTETRVLAVETHGTDSLNAALTAGKLVRLPKIDSVAKTLGAAQVATEAFEQARRRGVESIVIDDAQALSACRRFALDHRILVEPAAGAALAAVYEQLGSVPRAEDVTIIVCGGVGIALKDDIFAYSR